MQKIEHKVPSWYRSGIKFPSSLAVEQCSSERTAHFKAGLLQGRSMADLTGGLGIDAWAFAQRFASVTHVEFDNALAKAAKHNFALLQTPNIRCIHEEASVFLKNCPHRFDLAYLDPARRHALKGRVAQLSECTPNILKIKNLIFQCTDQALLKTAPMLDRKSVV